MLGKIDTRVIGSILLIVGTSIGGAMLALPVVNAATGFWYSSLFLITTWALMTAGAFLVLEVNLMFPVDSNLISMAHGTLGKFGEKTVWFIYLCLLYALLSAYMSGGTDVVNNLFLLAGLQLPLWFCTFLFVGVLGFVVYLGIHSVENANNSLMILKISAFVLLIIFATPHIELSKLEGGHPKYILSSLMVLVTSFGFAIVVPSLRSYFADDIKKLRKTIAIGASIPLVCYLLWEAAIMGVLPHDGPHALVNMMHSGHETTALTKALHDELNNPWITNLFRFFTSISMLTAFLGVSLSLSDFLADGLHRRKRGTDAYLVYSATFLPPLFIVFLYPAAFIYAFEYAGIICILLLIFIPALMAWYGRYQKHLRSQYTLPGGKPLLIFIFIACLVMTVVGLFENVWQRLI